MASTGESLRDVAESAADAAEPAVSVAKQVMAEVKDDHVTLMGAGVAFYGFLALIPGLIALVSIYGLVGDPDDIQAWVEDMGGAMPEEARNLLIQQLEAITQASGGALSISLVISFLVALWAASSGMGHLVEAVNMAHDEPESRNMVRRRILSVSLTIGAILFAIVAIAAIAVWPAVVSAIDPLSSIAWFMRVAVWPVLAVALTVGLAVLYHVGPDRDGEWRWITWGSAIAVLLWVVASIGFQVYVANFASYNETYGSLGAIIIMLLWLWLSALVVLVGAEINSVLEARRTA